MFAKGGSMSPFQPPPVLAANEGAEYFPRVNFQPQLDLFSEEDLNELKAAAEKEKATNKDKDAELAKLPAPERLLAKYGDPKRDTPVLAIENAPAPFKAMMESLQEGQDEMAFQYAKQYVRHLRNVQERSTHVMSLVGFAQKREGMIEGNDWENAPALVEDKALYEKDLIQSKKGSKADESTISIEAEKIVAAERVRLAGAKAPAGLPKISMNVEKALIAGEVR